MLSLIRKFRLASYRELGIILGMSKQRVHQIVSKRGQREIVNEALRENKYKHRHYYLFTVDSKFFAFYKGNNIYLATRLYNMVRDGQSHRVESTQMDKGWTPEYPDYDRPNCINLKHRQEIYYDKKRNLYKIVLRDGKKRKYLGYAKTHELAKDKLNEYKYNNSRGGGAINP